MTIPINGKVQALAQALSDVAALAKQMEEMATVVCRILDEKLTALGERKH